MNQSIRRSFGAVASLFLLVTVLSGPSSPLFSWQCWQCEKRSECDLGIGRVIHWECSDRGGQYGCCGDYCILMADAECLNYPEKMYSCTMYDVCEYCYYSNSYYCFDC